MFKDKFFNIEYISKFDKEDIQNIHLDKFYLDEKTSYLNKSKLWSKDFHYRRLSEAEISCAIKHIEALKKISESDQEYALIIEDDVLALTKFYINKLKKVMNTKDSWDILFIGQGISKDFILKKIKKKSFLSKLYEVNHPATNCAESYIVKKSAAKKIYESIKPFNMAYDWELAYQIYHLDLNVKWLYPPIFHQGSISGSYKSELR